MNYQSILMSIHFKKYKREKCQINQVSWYEILLLNLKDEYGLPRYLLGISIAKSKNVTQVGIWLLFTHFVHIYNNIE